MKKGRKKEARLAGRCRALSVESRTRILDHLKSGPLCVGALVGRLGLSQGAVSQHLRVLKEAGLVSSRKIGYFTHYQLDHRALEELARQIGSYITSTHNRKGNRPCAAERTNVRSQRT